MKKRTGVDAAKVDENMRPAEAATKEFLWHLPYKPPFRLAGFGWFEKEKVYRRLPVEARRDIREPVDQLANCTAGGQVSFRSNSRKISVRVKLHGVANMNHMPATGQCGFDLYIGNPGRQRFCSVTKYDHSKDHYTILLFEQKDPVMRTYTLNFPLYKGVKRVHIGLKPEAVIKPPPRFAREEKVIFYGTSITQGGCASRPGMAHSNILSRYLNMEFINLGFSGNGLGEPELAHLITEIPDPALYILDYGTNAGYERLKKTLPGFVRILRKKQPNLPILVTSKAGIGPEEFYPEVRRQRILRRDYQKDYVTKLRKKGDRNIFFLDSNGFLGKEGPECTVDGGHPTDLGFLRIAERLEPTIRKLLKL